MQDTFLHETFHAIAHVMGLKDTEKEESFVRRLATGLCTVWNQNPKAFKLVDWVGLGYSIHPNAATITNSTAADIPTMSFGFKLSGLSSR